MFYNIVNGKTWISNIELYRVVYQDLIYSSAAQKTLDNVMSSFIKAKILTENSQGFYRFSNYEKG